MYVCIRIQKPCFEESEIIRLRNNSRMMFDVNKVQLLKKELLMVFPWRLKERKAGEKDYGVQRK